MYVELKQVVDVGSTLWRRLIDLYREDPDRHVYLLHDLIYEYSNVDVLIDWENEILSYRLYWRGLFNDVIHVWSTRKCPDLDQLLDVDLINRLRSNSLIHVDVDKSCWDKIVSHLEKTKWSLEEARYIDMVVNEESFKPYYPDKARRLGLEDLDRFLELKNVQAREYWGRKRYDRRTASELLDKRRYYGVIVDGKLVSIACRYLGLLEVGVVGDVYTHPDHRDRGYAKIAASAITRDIVGYGAKALLHVARDNHVAIHVYERLGYRRVREKLWVFLRK